MYRAVRAGIIEEGGRYTWSGYAYHTPHPRHGTWDTPPPVLTSTIHTGGKRALCILLECFLVCYYIVNLPELSIDEDRRYTRHAEL